MKLPRVAKTVLAFVLAYALPIVLGRLHVYRLVEMELFHIDKDLMELFMLAMDALIPGYVAALVGAQAAALVGFLVRMVARARVRAGGEDPLTRARAFLANRSRQMQLTVIPAAAYAVLMTRLFIHAHRYDHRDLFAYLPGYAIPTLVVLLGQIILARRGLAALVAPTLDESETNETAEEARAEGFTFDAVAVTRETRAAVGGVAAVSLAMTALALSLPVSHMRDPAFFAALAAYVGLAGGAAIAFRRASRVSVGLDGVLVKGSSRTRFFGFRELDGARASGSDIELVRGERVVLTLQLHGKDAARRDALVKRLGAAIARASADRDEPSVSFVQSASSEDLARAAQGGGDYRRLAVSREQLWSVLEGPAIANDARRAAAEALAETTDPSERTRFRIAAEQCAEPSVRERMQELLGDADEDEHEIAGPAISARRATLAR